MSQYQDTYHHLLTVSEVEAISVRFGGNRLFDLANDFLHELHKKYGNGWSKQITLAELEAVNKLQDAAELKIHGVHTVREEFI